METVLQSIANHEAISQLRNQQDVLDQKGPLYASRSDLSFGLAMTLRDCTCFAVVPRFKGSNEGSPIPRVRLGDFDWKVPDQKFDVWQKTEQDLIDGGFYTAEWLFCKGHFYHPPTRCALEWKPRVSAKEPEVIILEESGNERTTTDLARPISQSRTYLHSTAASKLQSLLEGYKMDDNDFTVRTPRTPFRTSPRLHP
jgi:inositol-pentakisphosphate 2-kinase